MELLILLALTCWGGTRYLANEPARINERRQRSTQAHERRMQRLHARRGPTISQAISDRLAERIANPKGGPAREAIALWWSDSWGYATDRRLKRHERAERGELRRQQAAKAISDWLTIHWKRHQNRRATEKAKKRGDPVHADATVGPAPADADDVVDAEIIDTETNATQKSTGNTTKGATADTPAPDQTAPQETAEPTEKTQQPDTQGDDAPPDHAAPSPPTTTNDSTSEESSATGGDDGEGDSSNATKHMASVHPIRKDTTQMSYTSTISSGETVDPHAALAFVTGIGETAEHMRSQVELSVATLAERKVRGGSTINDLQEIGEKLAEVKHASDRAAQSFTRHIGIQDQVKSDPELAETVGGTYLGGG